MSLPLSGANITTGPFGVPPRHRRGLARNSRAVYQTTLSPCGPSPRDLVGGVATRLLSNPPVSGCGIRLGCYRRVGLRPPSPWRRGSTGAALGLGEVECSGWVFRLDI